MFLLIMVVCRNNGTKYADKNPHELSSAQLWRGGGTCGTGWSVSRLRTSYDCGSAKGHCQYMCFDIK